MHTLRSPSQINTPSISRALSGNITEDSDTEKNIGKTKLSEPEDDQSFTHNDLLKSWGKFTQRFKDQVHVFNTLSQKPKLENDCLVVVEVNNSVEEDKIKYLKPEIIGYLRRTLKNSKIDVEIALNKSNAEKKVLTDEQKLKAMIEKNPALLLFKNKFYLDFSA